MNPGDTLSIRTPGGAGWGDEKSKGTADKSG
jgi:N-methylhydantoinase B/oxoprolinase/acetone carboxylase alpha subunit